MAKEGEKTAQKGRIQYIEPNNIVSGSKRNRDNEVWVMEDYNISVDLQVITPLRVNTVTLSGNDEKVSITAMNNKNPIGRYVSFLQGSRLNQGKDGSLTDRYINSTYTEITNGNVSSTENLGITRIDVKFDEQFYPQVQITFVDVRGFSLMMPSERAMYQDKDFGNLFNALFHYPYPRFLLTLKGQYGGKVTLQLAVSEFYSSLNQDTGNFEVTVNFIGYMYGLYSDMPMNLLIAAPYYNCDDTKTKYKYWEEQVENGTFLFDNGQPIMTFVEYLGVVYDVNKKMANGELSEIATQLSALEDKLSLIKEVSAQHSVIVDSAYERTGVVESFKGDFYSVFVVHGTSANENTKNFLEKGIATKVANLDNAIAAFNNKSEGVKVEGISTSVGDYSLNSVFSSDFFTTTGLTVLTTNGKNTLSKSLLELDDPALVAAIKRGGYGNEDPKTLIESVTRPLVQYFIYNFKPAEEIINAAFTQCQEEISKFESENEERLQQEMKSALSDALGFSPTVENMYRMIFAHLDCFVHEFYTECLDLILTSDGEQSKRPLSILSGFNDDMLTNNGYDYIPPFPNVFRQEYDDNDHKYNELLWIGEEDGLKDLKEVEFINNLFDGVIAVKKAANEIFRREAAEAEAANNKYNWYPTNVLDYVHESNPYAEEMDSDMAKMKIIDGRQKAGYIHVFAKKRIEGAWATCEDDDDENGQAIAQLEAYNFYKAHPAPPQYLKTIFMEDKAVDTFKKIGAEFETNHGNVIFAEISPYFTSLDRKEDGRLYFTEISGITLNDFVQILYDTDKIVNFAQAWNSKPEPVNGVSFVDFEGRPPVSVEKPIGENAFLYEQPNGEQYKTHERMNELTRVYELSDFNEKKEGGTTPELYNKIVEEASRDVDGNSPTPTHRVPYMYYNGTSKDVINDGNHFENTALKIVAAIGTGKNNSLDQCIINNRSFLSLNSIESILWYCAYEKFANLGVKEYNKFLQDNFNRANVNMNMKLNVHLFQAMGSFWDAYIREKAVGGPLGKIIDLLKQPHVDADGRYSPKLSQAIIEFITTKAFFVRSRLVSDDVNPDDVMGVFWETLSRFYGFTRGSEENAVEEIGYKDITNSHRLALYETLKRLYDKWLSGYDKSEFILKDYQSARDTMKTRYLTEESSYDVSDSEFDNFIYIDSFYRDISNRYFLNPRVIYDELKNHIEADYNFSVYEFMYDVAQENKLLFIALPVYNNIYSPSHLEDIFKPHFYYNKANSSTLGMGTTYVIMYPHEVSHFADDDAMQHYTGYKDDGFDLADTNGNILPSAVELFKTDDNGLAYSVPAFGVTYAKQNQSYFKRINIDMNNPRVTDFSIANTFELGNMDEFGGAVNIQMVGQNLYSVFSNRSYVCTVEMVGCMNIMPMMYFQLNNIPMIKGAYIITNVHHSFIPGNATTTFSGVRVSKNTIPYNKDIFNFRVFKELVNNMGNVPQLTYDTSGEGGEGYSAQPIATGPKPFVGLSRDEKMQACVGMNLNQLNNTMNGDTFKSFISTFEYQGLHFEMNRTVVEDIKAIIDEILALGWFKISTVATHRTRNSTYPNGVSRHCLGMAIDINAGGQGNPYCKVHIPKDQTFKEGDKIPWPFRIGNDKKPISAYYGTYDKTKCIWTWDHPVVKIFEAHGWGWGGSYGDTMHFSVDNGS